MCWLLDLLKIEVIIALLLAYLAFKQYKLEESKYRHLLYEKRLIIFKAVKKHLSKVIVSSDYEIEEDFWIAMSESEFLFKDDSIYKYMKEIYEKTVRLEAKSKTNGDTTDDSEWFISQLEEHRSKFKKYLTI